MSGDDGFDEKRWALAATIARCAFAHGITPFELRRWPHKGRKEAVQWRALTRMATEDPEHKTPSRRTYVFTLALLRRWWWMQTDEKRWPPRTWDFGPEVKAEPESAPAAVEVEPFYIDATSLTLEQVVAAVIEEREARSIAPPVHAAQLRGQCITTGCPTPTLEARQMPAGWWVCANHAPPQARPDPSRTAAALSRRGDPWGDMATRQKRYGMDGVPEAEILAQIRASEPSTTGLMKSSGRTRRTQWRKE